MQPPEASMLASFQKLDVSPGTFLDEELEAHVTANGGVFVSTDHLTTWPYSTYT